MGSALQHEVSLLTSYPAEFFIQKKLSFLGDRQVPREAVTKKSREG
jgi:hypothetical protein